MNRKSLTKVVLVSLSAGLGQMTSAAAPAPAKPSVETTCSVLGSVYRSAAEWRDVGKSPQDTLMTMGGYRGVLSDDTIKKAINQVFFEQGFANARGPIFERQMRDLCLSGGQPKFQPLK